MLAAPTAPDLVGAQMDTHLKNMRAQGGSFAMTSRTHVNAAL